MSNQPSIEELNRHLRDGAAQGVAQHTQRTAHPVRIIGAARAYTVPTALQSALRAGLPTGHPYPPTHTYSDQSWWMPVRVDESGLPRHYVTRVKKQVARSFPHNAHAVVRAGEPTVHPAMAAHPPVTLLPLPCNNVVMWNSTFDGEIYHCRLLYEAPQGRDGPETLPR